MNLDLKPMLRGETNRMAVDFDVASDAPAGVTFGQIKLRGVITNQGGYMRLEAMAEVPYNGDCARCLSPVSGVYRMPFERTVVTEGTLTEEQEEDNIDEYVILQNGVLDIDDLLREALILSFPMRLLCREDCPGLCPICGKPLSEGSCSCRTKEIDPRWAILQTIRFDEDEDEGEEADKAETTEHQDQDKTQN